MRRGIRILSFAVAATLALQVLPWRAAARGFLGLSPLLGLGGALAARAATPWLLLGVPVLALAFFRSRWFCRYLCPTGFAAELVGRLNPRARRRFASWPNVGRVLLAILLGGAACGVPLFVWLDPLALFNGFFAAWRVPLAASSVALAAGFPLILLLSAFAPNAWCQKLCPLGAAQDLAARLRRAATQRGPAAPDKTFGLDLSRREFLGAAAGGAAALALRRTAAGKHPPIRPPGARPEDQFAGLCARCGACIRACPYGILKPDLGAGGVAGLLAPKIDYAKAHCFEYCNECTKVCPTGAIERLALDAKRNRAIGLAEIDRGKCIAWEYGQYCMVCHEFCPYLAIDSVERNGVECPTVKPDMCRGCGACQVNCPALPDKAIVVKSIPQRAARPLEA
jgi:ferredoxin